MGKSNTPTKARQRAIVDLMNKGITSPTEIVVMLKKVFDIETTRQTVHRDIANGVQPITEDVIEEHKDVMLDNLDELLKVAYDKGVRGDNKSMQTYGKLIKIRAEVLAKIVEIQQEMNRAERPVHLISIGKFPEAKKKTKTAKESTY